MSRGKYSPTVYGMPDRAYDQFNYNAKGKNPPSKWSADEYDEEIHFANYDSEGYDSYGYSAYNSEGKYVGICNGVDRNGYTEWDYLAMSDEEYEDHAR